MLGSSITVQSLQSWIGKKKGYAEYWICGKIVWSAPVTLPRDLVLDCRHQSFSLPVAPERNHDRCRGFAPSIKLSLSDSS
jgi:hypothetical protein